MTETIKVAGKFNATEEAILAYLYQHPGEAIGAKGLASILKPDEQESWKDIEEGIKTLIVAGLVKAQRVSDAQSVWHEKLRLTTKGEAEAIKDERRLKSITIELPEWMPVKPVEHDEGKK